MMHEAHTHKDSIEVLHWDIYIIQSHAGKVVLRSWYERNKHIFPASRWEPYDPEKSWDIYSVSVSIDVTV